MKKNFICRGMMLLAGITALASCTNEIDMPQSDSNRLQLTFGVNQQKSRAIHTDATLPDASPVGVKLDGYSYTGLTYTGTTASGKQTWTANQDVVLTDVAGTLYAYWPYSEAIDMTAIPVDMTAADQTDWLYATPVEGINEDNASANVVMNHAASNINITINKGAYKGTGAISNITIQSDAFATGGTFNVAQAEPAFTAYEGEGEPLSRTVDITTGSATDIMVVPNGTSAAITFNATIDGVQFTATSAALSLENGNSYQYTLKLSDINTYMTVDGFTVNPWKEVAKENLNMQQKLPVEGTIDLATAENGVYAVASNGLGATITDADESCIAVALITDNQRIMIEKYGEGEQNRDIIKAAYDADGATNTGYKMFYWGTYGTDVASIDNIVEESETLSDFNGKVKTHAIINTPDTDSYTTYANMGTYCVKFNEMNGGYNDWYIPAAGQMREINKNISDINQLLERIGGTKFSRGFYDYYWSTTEGNLYMAWFECFYGLDGGIYDKNAGYRVRFVRDID